MLTPATHKYLHFPPNMNFAGMLGERGIVDILHADEDVADFDEVDASE